MKVWTIYHRDYDEYDEQGIYTDEKLAEANLDLLNSIYRNNMSKEERGASEEGYQYWNLKGTNTDPIYERIYNYRRTIAPETGIMFYDAGKQVSQRACVKGYRPGDYFVTTEYGTVFKRKEIDFYFRLAKEDSQEADQYAYSTYKALLLMIQKGVEWVNKESA